MRLAEDDNVIALAETLVSLGSEARQVRKARGLTLKDVSRASGISLSHLSGIERGASTPSMATLQALARALDVTPDWFFARRPGKGPIERAFVVRAENRRRLDALYGEDEITLGFADELLSSSISGSFYMGMSVFAPYTTATREGLRRHEGEEHGLILEGELELRIGDEVMVLREGDSWSFDASVPHRARNRSDRPCRVVWTVSPVVIPRVIETPDVDADDAAEAS